MIAEYSVTLENKTKSELILFIKELQDMLKEKDKEIAKYEKIYKEYDCYRWVKELEKKDKIIDLMAKAMDKIQDPQVCKYCDNKINLNNRYCVDAGKCKEGIKQYFERKVRDER